MADSIDQLRVSFVEETRDLINELEDVLLSLDVDSVDAESIDQIFRSVHTIKGSGGMLGFEKVLEVTHHLEDIFDKVRSGDMVFSMELKDISLETIDVLKDLLAKNEQMNDVEKVRFTNLCRKIELFDVDTDLNSVAVDADQTTIFESHNLSMVTYLIKILPGINLQKELSHPKYLIKELSLLGKHLAFSKSGQKIGFNNFETANKSSQWIIFLATNEGQKVIEEIFEWVNKDMDVSIKKLIDGDLLAIDEAWSEIENKKSSVFDLSFDQLQELALKFQDKINVDKETDSEKKNLEVGKDESQVNGDIISSIRVSTDKVDQLMNLVSEMVTLQARLNLIASQKSDEQLKEVAEKYGVFSKQLRDNAFKISLVPFGVTITRYKRLVHDLSEQLGKQVNFITEGEDTVLDKKIIEHLSDPIMHILRNSVDHGIESTEEREELKKNKIGEIKMKIYHQSNNVIIKIIDDGRGIDRAQIRELGIKKQLITEDQNLTDNELLGLIFLPGFSSAKFISNISGRGVGLDVVKRNISDIRGAIEILTEKGKGTTFIIKLPLTLSIIDGLQVKIDERHFIIPLFQVDKILTLTNQVQESKLNQMMTIDGLQVPYFDLRADFNLGGEPPKRREIVVASFENERVAFIVDSVVGENQTVLKPLGKHYKNQDFISGGTILGDGSVALVLDVNKIVTEFSKNKN